MAFEDQYFEENRVDVSPLTLAEVASYLALDETPTAESDEGKELQCFIDATVLFFESFSNYTIVETQFKTKRPCWGSMGYLKKYPFKSLDSIKYKDLDNTLQTLNASKYEEIPTTIYYGVDIKEFPDLYDDTLFPIEVLFTVGVVNDSENNLPADLKVALLQHIAYLYENRGDCPNGACDLDCFLPASARATYEKYQVRELL